MGRTRAGNEPAPTRARPWSRSARGAASAPPASAAPSADAARTPLTTSPPVADAAAWQSIAESIERHRVSAAATPSPAFEENAVTGVDDPSPPGVTTSAAYAESEGAGAHRRSSEAVDDTGADRNSRTEGRDVNIRRRAAREILRGRRVAPSGRRSRRRGKAPDIESDGGRTIVDPASDTENPSAHGVDHEIREPDSGPAWSPTGSRGAGGNARERRRSPGRGTFRDPIAHTVAAEEPLARAGRVPGTLRDAGEFALHAVRKWADPRERELRRRRRVRRRSLRWSAASGVTALGTAGLVAISAPVWAVVVVGGGAAALVTGAAVSTRRYLELRRNPLPPAAFVPRRLPAAQSAARAPIARLVRAERAFHALGRQIEASGRIPADDFADTVATAASGAAALHALAGDIAAMEKALAVVATSHAGAGLRQQSGAMVGRLESGVTEYEQLVAAAGQILAAGASEAPTPVDEFGWAMFTLREAADRLDGWAQALTDLADRH